MKVLSTCLFFILIFSIGHAQHSFLVADIEPGTMGSYPYLLTPSGNSLYFTAGDYTESGLYRSETITNNTVKLTTTDYLGLEEIFVASNGTIFFTAISSPTTNYQADLYYHTGVVGTSEVKININPTGEQNANSLIEASGRIYLSASIATGTQHIVSVDINTFAFQTHIAPAPFNTAVYVSENKSFEVNGNKGIVQLGNNLFFLGGNIGNQGLFTLDHTNISAAPALVTTGISSDRSWGLYPFGNNVYFTHFGELKYSDGTSLNTLGTDVNAYYFKEFNGNLFFAGQSSAPANNSVMYSLNASNTLTEYPNIPLEGGIGNSQIARNFALCEFNGDLYGWLNNINTGGTVYALCKFDFTVPAVPTYSIELSQRPRTFYNMELINGSFYYDYYDFTAVTFSVNKNTAGVVSNIFLESFTDTESIGMKYVNGELYYSYKSSNSIDCSGPLNPGHELHKLSSYQLFCNNVANVDQTDLANFHGVVAAGQTINLNGTISLSTDKCTIFSAPTIITNGVFNLNPPSQTLANTVGCP